MDAPLTTAPPTARSCPSCAAAVPANVRFCEACGARLEPTPQQRRAQRSTSRSRDEKLTRARRYLLVVTVILLFQVILAVALMGNAPALAHQRAIIGLIGGMLVLGFAGLWLWSKHNPVAALLIALVAYLTLWGVLIAANPINLLSGILVRILAIGALIGGLRAGLAARAEAARDQRQAEGLPNAPSTG